MRSLTFLTIFAIICFVQDSVQQTPVQVTVNPDGSLLYNGFIYHKVQARPRKIVVQQPAANPNPNVARAPIQPRPPVQPRVLSQPNSPVANIVKAVPAVPVRQAPRVVQTRPNCACVGGNCSNCAIG